MRKNSEGEIRVRCAEAERGFLAGVKEMVKMRAEMGVMPWGKHGGDVYWRVPVV